MAYYLPWGTSLAASGSDPYTWFPSFNKNLFPPHAGAGAWGAQSTIKEAAAPTGTMTDVNVATAAELETQLAIPNRRITLTADITSGGYADTAPITDVDLIIPAGRLLANYIFGHADPVDTEFTRFRIRGSTVGSTTSGGQMHNCSFICATTSTDVIIEGLNLSAPGGNNGALLFQGEVTRVAIHNNKIHSGGYGYIGTCSDLTFVNNSLMTAVDTVSQLEAWGWRVAVQSSGNIIFYGNDNRASTNRGTVQVYHRSRYHPGANTDYIWDAYNTSIDRVEAQILICNSGFGNSDTDAGDADCVWYDNNTVIATSAAGSQVYLGDAQRCYITNNVFKSDRITSTSNFSFGPEGTRSSEGLNPTTTGNTFESLPGSDPAWGAAGDPTGIDWTP